MYPHDDDVPCSEPRPAPGPAPAPPPSHKTARAGSSGKQRPEQLAVSRGQNQVTQPQPAATGYWCISE